MLSRAISHLIFIFVLMMTITSGQVIAKDKYSEKSANKKNVFTGKVDYKTCEHDKTIPEQFRVKAHQFTYRQKVVSWKGDATEISRVTFPSPIKTPHINNNTIHCEFFLPTKATKEKPVPGVVVLHILGGDFTLSRLFCGNLANRGVAALFVKMPYYGPRRQPGVSVRMIDKNPQLTVKGMTQAVQDIRCARAWLSSRPQVDEKQLGLFGISLGGITASLVASLEPRFTKVCPMLAGGGLGKVLWESKELKKYKNYWKKNGYTQESIEKILKVVDPVTYAKPVKGRKIFMLNASKDEVVPPACSIELWKAFGKPKIVWYKSGHYSAIAYLFDAMSKVADFFQPEEQAVKTKKS